MRAAGRAPSEGRSWVGYEGNRPNAGCSGVLRAWERLGSQLLPATGGLLLAEERRLQGGDGSSDRMEAPVLHRPSREDTAKQRRKRAPGDRGR